MALANYSDLQTTVGNYLHRSDLTSMIPDFITLAEAKLNRELRLRAMENTANGTVAASISLPTGFIEMRGISVGSGNSTWNLTYTPTSDINSETGTPTKYSISGELLYFLPYSTAYSYTIDYYAAFAALSAGVNWLITNAPDVYLYATLLEASPYIKDDSRIGTWAQLLADSVTRLQNADNRDRHGSNLVVRAA
jgi:hypothetical protein